MEKQKDQVIEFYSSIAESYKLKYNRDKPFFQYFFQGRMHEATSNESFERKSILDIGAGPGNLYDYIKQRTKTFEYFAADITSSMLEHSSVPSDRRFVGHCYDLSFPIKEFDYIYLLGVTTYMSPEELQKTLTFIKSHLSPHGKAIITFSNKGSLDYVFRTVLGFLVRPLGLKGRVLGQNFQTYPYTKGQIVKMLSEFFKIERIAYLNQTVFPFNRAFTNISIIAADFIKKNFRGRLLSTLSSDILAVLKI